MKNKIILILSFGGLLIPLGFYLLFNAMHLPAFKYSPLGYIPYICIIGGILLIIISLIKFLVNSKTSKKLAAMSPIPREKMTFCPTCGGKLTGVDQTVCQNCGSITD